MDINTKLFHIAPLGGVFQISLRGQILIRENMGNCPQNKPLNTETKVGALIDSTPILKIKDKNVIKHIFHIKLTKTKYAIIVTCLNNIIKIVKAHEGAHKSWSPIWRTTTLVFNPGQKN